MCAFAHTLHDCLHRCGIEALVAFTKELQDGKLLLSHISTDALDADAVTDIVQVYSKLVYVHL